jgi:hypothetical protein
MHPRLSSLPLRNQKPAPALPGDRGRIVARLFRSSESRHAAKQQIRLDQILSPVLRALSQKQIKIILFLIFCYISWRYYCTVQHVPAGGISGIVLANNSCNAA